MTFADLMRRALIYANLRVAYGSVRSQVPTAKIRRNFWSSAWQAKILM
ncbi:hypothetical protein [Myxacorys almedinensis]|uniref:Uncharacterized protein n=1 Tax=Myxacorys almedinensis A TaxID=2690445 RepID=A0A8J7Z4J0_9CYAN|nr:hypothetical protein [Myxacorys almedinensis]NDJ18031.1 hypothetical protein [Myxacorys almedinensis A]